MNYNVKNIDDNYDFEVDTASYIGAPRSNTFMFISKKVGKLLSALEDVEQCLIFAEDGLEVAIHLKEKHCFVFSENPQLAYARFAIAFLNARNAEDRKIPLKQENGSYVSESASIGENAYIEPGCYIGPGVVIGKNAQLFKGTVIKNSVIGDNFIANEYAVVGAFGFTMAEDENGNKLRIPTLGRVVIGDNVEVGAHDNISCGSGGDTVIEDNVKIDALVHIGHDAHLKKNVEITAAGIIGGFDVLEEHAYVGINAVLRNRITIGSNTTVGMGSTVTKSFPDNLVIAGNPAKELRKA